MFELNTWYVACMPADLDEKPLGRTICGQRMVFFRGSDGTVAALDDWCPHRGAPLSLGRVIEGKLVCGYHGLEMGCEGRALSMPGQRVRGFPAITKYPAIERYGFIWVWPGDATKADQSLIPVLHWAQDPAWAYGGGMYHIQCGYQLMVDNLMDLTHETYVHADSIGQPEIDDTPPVTAVDGEHVTTSRYMNNISAPPFWRMALRNNGLADDVPVDRWQVCHFTPPSHVMIEVGVAHAGKGGYDAAPEHKASSVVVDFITPETETSIWYFWGMARKFRPDDKALTAKIREGQGKIFSEDMQMLEQQQRNLSLYPQRKLLSLNTDSGGMQSRRIIERRIAAERASSAPENVSP